MIYVWSESDDRTLTEVYAEKGREATKKAFPDRPWPVLARRLRKLGAIANGESAQSEEKRWTDDDEATLRRYAGEGLKALHKRMPDRSPSLVTRRYRQYINRRIRDPEDHRASWSRDDIRALRTIWEGGLAAACHALPFEREAIEDMARAEGLLTDDPPSMKSLWTQAKDQYLQSMIPVYGARHCATHFNIPLDEVKKRVEVLGIAPHPGRAPTLAELAGVDADDEWNDSEIPEYEDDDA